jgi:inosine-uridine nucleoside N-ribohydrolase
VPIPVVLDCDPGHDDAIALLLALASPELELLGVTTTYGNQTLEKTTSNALRVLKLVNRTDVRVAAGAERPFSRELAVASDVHGESGLDGPELPPPSTEAVPDAGAVEFIARTLRFSERRVTLVATGPLTNLASFLELHGRHGIERVVLMGGSIAEGNVTPAAEFNIWCDPEAAHAVFHSGLDVTMVGLDVTHQAIAGPAETERLRAAGRIGEFVAELLEFFGRFHRRTYGWDGAPIHDAVALAYLVNPDVVETRHLNVEVELESELCRGRTVVDLWGRTERAPNAHVGLHLDASAFFDLLVERIASLG